MLIDGDGEPVDDQDARQPYTPGPVRRVYVDQPEDDEKEGTKEPGDAA